jgi:hypothetical protein
MANPLAHVVYLGTAVNMYRSRNAGLRAFESKHFHRRGNTSLGRRALVMSGIDRDAIHCARIIERFGEHILIWFLHISN